MKPRPKQKVVKPQATSEVEIEQQAAQIKQHASDASISTPDYPQSTVTNQLLQTRIDQDRARDVPEAEIARKINAIQKQVAAENVAKTGIVGVVNIDIPDSHYVEEIRIELRNQGLPDVDIEKQIAEVKQHASHASISAPDNPQSTVENPHLQKLVEKDRATDVPEAEIARKINAIQKQVAGENVVKTGAVGVVNIDIPDSHYVEEIRIELRNQGLPDVEIEQKVTQVKQHATSNVKPQATSSPKQRPVLLSEKLSTSSPHSTQGGIPDFIPWFFRPFIPPCVLREKPSKSFSPSTEAVLPSPSPPHLVYVQHPLPVEGQGNLSIGEAAHWDLLAAQCVSAESRKWAQLSGAGRTLVVYSPATKSARATAQRLFRPIEQDISLLALPGGILELKKMINDLPEEPREKLLRDARWCQVGADGRMVRRNISDYDMSLAIQNLIENEDKNESGIGANINGFIERKPSSDTVTTAAEASTRLQQKHHRMAGRPDADSLASSALDESPSSVSSSSKADEAEELLDELEEFLRANRRPQAIRCYYLVSEIALKKECEDLNKMIKKVERMTKKSDNGELSMYSKVLQSEMDFRKEQLSFRKEVNKFVHAQIDTLQEEIVAAIYEYRNEKIPSKKFERQGDIVIFSCGPFLVKVGISRGVDAIRQEIEVHNKLEKHQYDDKVVKVAIAQRIASFVSQEEAVVVVESVQKFDQAFYSATFSKQSSDLLHFGFCDRNR